MLYIDLKYVGYLSNRLDKFKRKSNTTFNCRCPLCGDSQSNRHKMRGYIYEKGGNLLYFCHNCGASMSFRNFLKTVDATLYQEYAQEKFIDKYSANQSSDLTGGITFASKPKFLKDSPLKKLKKISQLVYNHPAKLYVEKRKIPTNQHYRLFYAPHFKTWVNTIIPGKFEVDKDEPRLIIPFIDEDKNCYGFQGRSFSSKGIRYITIMIDPDAPKVFGLDTLVRTQTIYVLEGPLDSLFLPNAVAMAGADMNLGWLQKEHQANVVYVYDNEPRNADIIKRMQKIIDIGHRVCIWPQSIFHKDINDMVMAGIEPAEIKGIIDSNTYQGLDAQLNFTMWKKV